MSSVRYGTRLGDLKKNWFLCFPKHSTHDSEGFFNLFLPFQKLELKLVKLELQVEVTGSGGRPGH